MSSIHLLERRPSCGYALGTASNSGQITITVMDGGIDNDLMTIGDNLSISQTIAIVSTNNPPAVSLINTVTTLAENSSTTPHRKLAGIQVTDDGVGGQVVTLSGTDARFFEIVGAELFLAAGVALIMTTETHMAIVAVDDTNVGNTPDATATLTLNITDVNEPPSVTLINPTTTMLENIDSATRRKVAEILAADDTPNVLRLSGPDASRFEIFNQSLYLVAGTVLDYESQSRLQVTVEVDDPDAGRRVDASADYALSIIDLNEQPSELFLSNNRIGTLADTASGPVFVGQLVAIDEDRTTERLRVLFGGAEWAMQTTASSK